MYSTHFCFPFDFVKSVIGLIISCLLVIVLFKID